MMTVISLRLIMLLAGLLLGLILALAWILRRQDRLEKTLQSLLRGSNRELDAIESLDHDLLLEGDFSVAAFNRVGLVHYDAFDSDHHAASFSLCLLNDLDEGMVLTALSYEDSHRLYAKKVLSGQIEGPASDEELRALADARGFGMEKERHDEL